MNALKTKSIAAGTRVKVITPGVVPDWSAWDDDGQRVSNSVKKRLQQLFFRGDRRVNAAVVYIIKESEREKLRKKGWIKVEVRDASGSTVVITAEPDSLKAA